MYVDVVRKWVFWESLHLGVLSNSKKGAKLTLSVQHSCVGVEFRFKIFEIINKCVTF